MIRSKSMPSDDLAFPGLVEPETIQATLPAAKWAAAVLGWANSGVTSMLTGAQLQTLAWARQTGLPADQAPFPLWGVVLGIAAAVIFSVGQVFTSGRSRWGYRVCLAPDATTTAWQWYRWVVAPVCLALIPLALAARLVASLISLLIGVYSAKLPEWLVFGRRRKVRRAARAMEVEV